MTPYKTLNGTMGSYGHGDYTGYLPKGKRPGKWLPKVKPELCVSGYHYCTDPLDLLTHYGPDLYEVQVRGEVFEGGDKSAAEQMRLVRRVEAWNDDTLRLFGVDCARKVAHLTDNPELTHAVLDTVVGYVEGWCDDAASAAARDAAWAAAWAMAWAAARDAARATAWATTWGAARAAERESQRSLLLRYLNGEQGPFVERDS